MSHSRCTYMAEYSIQNEVRMRMLKQALLKDEKKNVTNNVAEPCTWILCHSQQTLQQALCVGKELLRKHKRVLKIRKR